MISTLLVSDWKWSSENELGMCSDRVWCGVALAHCTSPTSASVAFPCRSDEPCFKHLSFHVAADSVFNPSVFLSKEQILDSCWLAADSTYSLWPSLNLLSLWRETNAESLNYCRKITVPPMLNSIWLMCTTTFSKSSQTFLGWSWRCPMMLCASV